MKICVVIPAYNEANAIADTINEYREVFPESCIVVVDNNSTDATSENARRCLTHTDILLVERKQGKGFAVKAGLSRVDADIYILTDGDATYPALDAKRLYNEILERRCDMVVGDRVSGGAYAAQNTRPGHSWGNKLLTIVISGLAGQKYKDVLSGLRIMSRPFVSNLDVRSSGFQLETELNVLAAYLRADVIESPIDYRQRGEDSHSKLNTIRDGIRIVRFAFFNWVSFAPMQLFMILASVMSILSLLLIYRVIEGYINTGWPYTTTATAAVATGLIAILSTFFGLALRISGRNMRRFEISRFLEMKRAWNKGLDEKSF